jgi:hypothetical protein
VNRTFPIHFFEGLFPRPLPDGLPVLLGAFRGADLLLMISPPPLGIHALPIKGVETIRINQSVDGSAILNE